MWESRWAFDGDDLGPDCPCCSLLLRRLMDLDDYAAAAGPRTFVGTSLDRRERELLLLLLLLLLRVRLGVLLAIQQIP